MAARENGWVRKAQQWRKMPLSSTLYFIGGVFSLFAAIGCLNLGMEGLLYTTASALFLILLSGGFAVGYAIAGTRRVLWLLFSTPILQMAGYSLFGAYHHGIPSLREDGTALLHQVQIYNVAGIVLVALGYVLFLVFFGREGNRFFKAHTEIRLAAEIHKALVPDVARKSGSYEFLGASQPSGEVGGDLVDVIASEGNWLAYVADVSGHGVSAGVLMAMVKSAVHTCVAAGESGSKLLPALNRVLQSCCAVLSVPAWSRQWRNSVNELELATRATMT